MQRDPGEMMPYNRKISTRSSRTYEVRVLETQESDRGLVTTEFWRVKGRLHREDGPALIKRHKATGIVIKELWALNGRAHREDGPAMIDRSPHTGKITYSSWRKNGERIQEPPKDRSPVDQSASALTI